MHIHVYIADLVLSLASLLIAHSKYKLKQDSGIKKSYTSGGLGVSKMITRKRLGDFNFTLSSWFLVFLIETQNYADHFVLRMEAN